MATEMVSFEKLQEAQFIANIQAELRDKYGIVWRDGFQYRLTDRRDTQDIPTANNTEIAFFAQSTSERGAHTRGEEGCNLREKGKMDDDFLVVSLMVEFAGLQTLVATDLADLSLVQEKGYLRSLWVHETPKLESIPLSAMMSNRGFTAPLWGNAAAIDGDFAVFGQPGLGGLGWQLPVFARPYIRDGDTLKAVIVQNSGTALTTALTTCFRMYGIEIRPK